MRYRSNRYRDSGRYGHIKQSGQCPNPAKVVHEQDDRHQLAGECAAPIIRVRPDGVSVVGTNSSMCRRPQWARANKPPASSATVIS
ncbi:hypothetical protein GCM10023321_49850 [Pseudonocardia eucalypti]|uniref:Uncharacterized protein n=1 Tax=Pseudonocardia eucalypti TaxID=648755 RepID=A0ABP9QKM6_9PSEU